MQKLERHVERIERWREAFCDETTGIRKSVEDLLWNYAAFQTTVQIVHLASERHDESANLNQMFFNMISEGYWSSLLLGTRRLLDNTAVKGEAGVYSIRAVVKDVEASRCWLNRKIYVEHLHGAEYDLERLREEQHNKLVATQGPVWASRDLINSEQAHRYFDELSGVTQPDRCTGDLIDPAIFAKINTRLAGLEGIVDYVNTHVAHAGNKESRQSKTLENFDIQDARTTLKKLKEVSTLVGVWFANEGSGDLATSLDDQFEGLDRPIVSSADIQKLENHWETIEKEIAGWRVRVEEL